MTSASKNKDELKYFINKITRVSFTLIIIFSIILALISNEFIYIVFGKDFMGASRALILLLPGISIFSVSNIICNYMAGIGKIQYNIYSSFISFLFTMAFNLILVPRIGIDGAAIATSLSYVVYTATAVVFYVRITKARVSDVLFIKREDINEIIGFAANKLKKRNQQGE
jgi:O-antigen/teichoic acid export membrane protein